MVSPTCTSPDRSAGPDGLSAETTIGTPWSSPPCESGHRGQQVRSLGLAGQVTGVSRTGHWGQQDRPPESAGYVTGVTRSSHRGHRQVRNRVDKAFYSIHLSLTSYKLSSQHFPSSRVPLQHPLPTQDVRVATVARPAPALSPPAAPDILLTVMDMPSPSLSALVTETSRVPERAGSGGGSRHALGAHGGTEAPYSSVAAGGTRCMAAVVLKDRSWRGKGLLAQITRARKGPNSH